MLHRCQDDWRRAVWLAHTDAGLAGGDTRHTGGQHLAVDACQEKIICGKLFCRNGKKSVFLYIGHLIVEVR